MAPACNPIAPLYGLGFTLLSETRQPMSAGWARAVGRNVSPLSRTYCLMIGKSQGDHRDPQPQYARGFPARLTAARHHVGDCAMVIICKSEPTLDELLADAMMATVLQHANTTADDVPELRRQA